MRLGPANLHLRDTDGAIIPLPSLSLPEEIEVGGEDWLRKPEFHVTAAHIETLARFGDPRRIRAELRRITWDFEVGAIELGDELRIVREGDERTIVVMADAPDVERLHRRLGEALCVELEPPPAHVTIYTGPEERGGIGLHSAEDVERLSTPLGGADAERLRAALEAAIRP